MYKIVSVLTLALLVMLSLTGVTLPALAQDSGAVLLAYTYGDGDRIAGIHLIDASACLENSDDCTPTDIPIPEDTPDDAVVTVQTFSEDRSTLIILVVQPGVGLTGSYDYDLVSGELAEAEPASGIYLPSPDGTQVAWNTFEQDALIVVDVTLTTNDDIAGYGPPNWSADGTRVGFSIMHPSNIMMSLTVGTPLECLNNPFADVCADYVSIFEEPVCPTAGIVHVASGNLSEISLSGEFCTEFIGFVGSDQLLLAETILPSEENDGGIQAIYITDLAGTVNEAVNGEYLNPNSIVSAAYGIALVKNEDGLVLYGLTDGSSVRIASEVGLVNLSTTVWTIAPV